MSAKKETKAGCGCGACHCVESTVVVHGKKFCSTTCADGKHTDTCDCGHPDCKPK